MKVNKDFLSINDQRYFNIDKIQSLQTIGKKLVVNYENDFNKFVINLSQIINIKAITINEMIIMIRNKRQNVWEGKG